MPWFSLKRSDRPNADPAHAMLSATPLRNKLVRSVTLSSGSGLRLIAPRRRTWLQGLFLPKPHHLTSTDPTKPAPHEKAFDLDELGQFVWHACDGHCTVRQIIESFATQQQVNTREAQVAVILFLRTLQKRNLIAFKAKTIIKSSN